MFSAYWQLKQFLSSTTTLYQLINYSTNLLMMMQVLHWKLSSLY